MKPWTYQKNSDTIGILTDYFIQQEEFMYKAIFFDLDGTLTESGEGITKSVQYALENGFERHSDGIATGGRALNSDRSRFVVHAFA